MTVVVRAPGKVNLCLFLGPVRLDGRHELVTMFESVSLADTVEMTVARGSGPGTGADRGPDPAPGADGGPDPAPGADGGLGPGVGGDQVVCAGVDGLNIVTQTLDGLRARGWNGPPLRVVIEKRIPVAGGMGGGSADAAAVLRAAHLFAPVDDATLVSLAASLGADVPSQLTPGLVLGTGAGEEVEPMRRELPPHAFVIVPQPFGLSTPEVYREADRLGLPRDAADLEHRLRMVSADGMPELINDLEPAALSLRPEIGLALDAVRAAGAEVAIVSGSGPTVFGLIGGREAPARAEAAAARLADRYPEATSAAPVSEEFGAPRGS